MANTPYHLRSMARIRSALCAGRVRCGSVRRNSLAGAGVGFPVNYYPSRASSAITTSMATADRRGRTGSGVRMHLGEIADELERGLVSAVPARRRGAGGRATATVADTRRSGVQRSGVVHEYFHGDNGRGLGASTRPGGTALAANLIERVAAAGCAGERHRVARADGLAASAMGTADASGRALSPVLLVARTRPTSRGLSRTEVFVETPAGRFALFVAATPAACPPRRRAAAHGFTHQPWPAGMDAPRGAPAACDSS